MEHYISMNHREDEFLFTVLYTDTFEGPLLDLELCKSEAYWISRLDMIQPRGLNLMMDLSCFL